MAGKTVTRRQRDTMHVNTEKSAKQDAAVETLEEGVCRDIPSAVRTIDGVDAATVQHRAAMEQPDSRVVPEGHERIVFEVTGLNCETCAALIETVLIAEDGISNTSASHRYGSVRVDHDPEEMSPDRLQSRLDSLGYPVKTTDEAFDNRRSQQWAGARYAMGMMAGLMVFAPYAGVVWPVRFNAFFDPVVIELLESALASAFASHFYLNLALLSGIVVLFTGGPILSEAETALRSRSPDASLVIAASVVGLYLYSTVTAFSAVTGGVYYDVVVLAVLGVTIGRQADLATVGTSSGGETVGSVVETEPDTMAEHSE